MEIERIAGHPAFRRLAFERGCLGLGLAAAMAGAYFTYILTIAFRPALLGLPVAEGSAISWGIVAGVGLLGLGFLLTAIYVLVANTRLDALSRRLQEDLR
ncbi:protein of unknown function DUF485 [Methylobacterium sp. 4-46]|uniref:DUF485 domain-containing protein n=1 Tax=unclassified Methylobacterium TaxID=2615210 RepID=UPI000152E503|nr:MULTISPECIES: DUF485 domain-containing protein [Methylobacterium]ACA18276.1 protein of unknown function DUF485 [Methylobacterium sp. 4-46]WFT77575.1 DUF485 domain-containing protein [Methylobacterium nodulans]